VECFSLSCSSSCTSALLRMFTSSSPYPYPAVSSLALSEDSLVSTPGPWSSSGPEVEGKPNSPVSFEGCPRTAHNSISSSAKDSNGEQPEVFITIFVPIMATPRIRREKGAGSSPVTQEQFHSLPPLTTASRRNSLATSSVAMETPWLTDSGAWGACVGRWTWLMSSGFKGTRSPLLD
jgi:hypothetical protein